MGLGITEGKLHGKFSQNDDTPFGLQTGLLFQAVCYNLCSNSQLLGSPAAELRQPLFRRLLTKSVIIHNVKRTVATLPTDRQKRTSEFVNFFPQNLNLSYGINSNFSHYLFNINQLDALNFIISLFQASTCFEHMCSSSGGENCIIQSLVSY